MIKPIAALWCQCELCGHEWLTLKKPGRCAKCKGRMWNGTTMPRAEAQSVGDAPQGIKATVAPKRGKRGANRRDGAGVRERAAEANQAVLASGGELGDRVSPHEEAAVRVPDVCGVSGEDRSGEMPTVCEHRAGSVCPDCVKFFQKHHRMPTRAEWMAM